MKTKLFLFLMLLLMWPFSGYATTGEIEELHSAEEIKEDKGKSIRELKDNLEKLDDEKDDLNGRLTTLKQESELTDFFKKVLTPRDRLEIKGILELYNLYNSRLDKQLARESKEFKLTNETKNQLLTERKELYLKLIDYIEPSKIDDYMEYIRTDAQILKESKDVKEEIHRKRVIVIEKEDVIKEKIKKHNKLMSEKLEKLINDRLDEKINNIKNNKSFSLLNDDIKINLLDKTILSVESKITKLKASSISNSFILKKIRIYELALNKIEELKVYYTKTEEL